MQVGMGWNGFVKFEYFHGLRKPEFFYSHIVLMILNTTLFICFASCFVFNLLHIFVALMNFDIDGMLKQMFLAWP